MNKQIFIILLVLSFVFIRLNSIILPYFFSIIFISIYLVVAKAKINEVVLAFTLFGFTFFQISTKLFGLTNIVTVFGGICFFLIYQFLTKWKLGNKLRILGNSKILFLYILFLGAVTFSMADSYILYYQNFKINLFFLWTLIYLLSINSFNVKVSNFDFETFILLSFFLFLPIFATIDIEELSYSPLDAWQTFSITNIGLRGTSFDTIQSARLAGIGVISIIISLLNFNKEKIYQFFLLIPFLIIMVICQSRQVFLSVFLSVFVVIIYYALKGKVNKFAIVGISLFLIIVSFQYVKYLDENEVESRVVSSVEDGQDIESGREGIWDASLEAIINGKIGVGYGNFYQAAHAHLWPHNIFLEIFIEVGYVGLVIFLIILVYFVYALIKSFFDETPLINFFLLSISFFYILVAQFSFDLSKNLLFFFTFYLYLVFQENYESIKDLDV
jgi:hypothetical protein